MNEFERVGKSWGAGLVEKQLGGENNKARAGDRSTTRQVEGREDALYSLGTPNLLVVKNRALSARADRAGRERTRGEPRSRERRERVTSCLDATLRGVELG